jgi:putative hydrolase of the HAD superfamily
MQYLIWDFDGTLAERKGMWSGALLEALEGERPSHGATIESIRPYLRTGFPWHEPHNVRDSKVSADDWWQALYPVFIRAYCEGLQLEHVQARRLCKAVREAYLNPKSWALFDDTLPSLKVLAAGGWKHVILSNHVPELVEIVRALGIGSYFEAIFNSAETGIEKPHPRAFQNVIASLDPFESAWMIGDNITADVKGATAAGLQAVLVRNPHADATIYFDTLIELATFLTAPSRKAS